MKTIHSLLSRLWWWTLLALGSVCCSFSPDALHAEQLPASVSFYVDGIYYRLHYGDSTVVVANGDFPYTGNVVVPSSIRFGRQAYKVVGVEYGAFSGSRHLISIILPASITTIDEMAFNGCYRLKNVDIIGPIDSIPQGVFMFCKSMEELTLPASVTYLGANVFRCCTALQTVHLPQHLQTIDFDAFAQSSIRQLVLPDEMCTLGTRALASCSKLKTLRLGKQTKQLKDNALAYCTRLQRIDILTDSLIISPSTLHACTSLRELWLYSDWVLTLETTDSSAVTSILPARMTLRVPHHLKQQYQQHPLWKNFTIKALKR
jgi:hypothetical protein